MIAIIAKRLAQWLGLVVALCTVVFVLLHLAGDPVLVLAGQNASAEQVALVREAYGLDKPLVLQYLNFLAQAATLDFGTSLLSKQPVTSEVFDRLAPTVVLAGMAMLANIVVSTILGLWIGANAKTSKAARTVETLLILAQGVPYFVVSILLIQLFAIELGLLPSIGWTASGSWILPTLSLMWILTPKLTRVISTNVAGALEQDYFRTAIALGATRRRAVLKEALPNAVLSSGAFAGTQLGLLLSGTVIVETIFAWPGLGLLLVRSAVGADVPVVLGAVVVIASMVFVANLVIDLIFKIVDPRIRPSLVK